MTVFHSIALTCRSSPGANGKSDAAAIRESSLACQ